MRRHTLALTALSAAVTLAVGVPATASAQTWRHTDPAGDVTKYTYNLDTDEETEAVDPTITNGDVIGRPSSTTRARSSPRCASATWSPARRPEPVRAVHPDQQAEPRPHRLRHGRPERGEHDLARPNGAACGAAGVAPHRLHRRPHVTMSVPPFVPGQAPLDQGGAPSPAASRAGWTSWTPGRTGDAPTPRSSRQYVDDAHSKPSATTSSTAPACAAADPRPPVGPAPSRAGPGSSPRGGPSGAGTRRTRPPRPARGLSRRGSTCTSPAPPAS